MGLLLVEQNLGVATAICRAPARHGRGRDRDRDDRRGDPERSRRPAALPGRDAASRRPRASRAWRPSSSSARSTRRASSTPTCATRLREHGVDVVLVDAGVLGEPLAEPDVAPRGGRAAPPARTCRPRRGRRPRRRRRGDGARRGGGRDAAPRRRAGSTAILGARRLGRLGASPRTRCARCRSACPSSWSRPSPRATRGPTSARST